MLRSRADQYKLWKTGARAPETKQTKTLQYAWPL